MKRELLGVSERLESAVQRLKRLHASLEAAGSFSAAELIEEIVDRDLNEAQKTVSYLQDIA